MNPLASAFAWGATILALVASAACGKSSGCPPGTSSPDAPQVTGLGLVTNAMPGDPWQLVFTVDFTDDDGDLGYGEAEVYLDDAATPTRLELFRLFRESALAFEATSGQFMLPLHFTGIADGDDVRLTLALIDQAQNRSPCYSADVAFQVQGTQAWLKAERRCRLASRVGLLPSSHGG